VHTSKPKNPAGCFGLPNVMVRSGASPFFLYLQGIFHAERQAYLSRRDGIFFLSPGGRLFYFLFYRMGNRENGYENRFDPNFKPAGWAAIARVLNLNQSCCLF